MATGCTKESLRDLPLPIIIIGAPRSGTNMLRDIICRMQGIGTWPCDEINYIWRHGHIDAPSDAFPAEYATDNVKEFIKSRFEKLASSQNLDFVVEKTCANSLRVDFVDSVLPTAKYLYLVRNGIDATASAMQRWTAPIDIPYLIKKARFVPIPDLPHYAVRYLMNRLHKLSSGESRLATWGPKFDGMKELVASRPLHEICALQWKECVDRADDSFQRISPKRIHRIRYEDFVEHPADGLAQICSFLDLPYPTTDEGMVLGHVSKRSIGSGRSQLGEKISHDLHGLIDTTLERHGYK